MVEMRRFELLSKNQLLIRNLILTLQVLCISFYLYSLPYTNLKSKSMQISKSLKAVDIDNLPIMAVFESLIRLCIFLSATGTLHRSYLVLRKGYAIKCE